MELLTIIVRGQLVLLATFVDYFKWLYQRSLYVFYSEGAVTDVFTYVQRVKHDEWVGERPLARIFAEYYFVAAEIVLVRFEADTVEMEEAAQVSTEGFLFVCVESVEVGRHHEYETEGADASAIRYAQERLIEYLLYDHYYWAKVLALHDQFLYMINRINARMCAMSHWPV